MRERNYFGSMLVEMGDADALVSGITRNYPSTLRPALQIIGTEEGVDKVAGMFVMNTKKVRCFWQTQRLILTQARELANIATLTAKTVKRFNMKPRIAMLSYSNFGSSQTKGSKKNYRSYGVT